MLIPAHKDLQSSSPAGRKGQQNLSPASLLAWRDWNLSTIPLWELRLLERKYAFSKLPCWNLPPYDFPPLDFPVITEDKLGSYFADIPSILTSSRLPPGWRGAGSPLAPPRRHTHMRMRGRQALGPDRWVETTLHFVTMTASYFCTSAVLQNISDFFENPGTFFHKDFFWRS